MIKFLILGAGPAGLSLANRLLDANEKNFLVLEAESEAGGLCRSACVDGSPLDIGGGHFLDVRRPEVNQFLFRFMSESEWNLFDRDSRIQIGNQIIHHPIEANIWEMDQESQVEYLKSIAMAGCISGKKRPKHFVDWITWKLGKKIADDYMLPYNRKMFGNKLNKFGTYWLEKLPDVNFEDTLRSCLARKPYGKQPGHAQFYYPKKYGYGELWLRMAERLGNNIQYKQKVTRLDFSAKEVETVEGQVYQAECIVTSIPWCSIKKLTGMPSHLKSKIKRLKHTSVQVEYIPQRLDTEAHWIYYPDPKLPYHRILVRHNFCPDSQGHWTETNGETAVKNASPNNFSNLNEYAYPLNTIGKNELMEQILGWAKTHNVIGLGRWGEHQHYNSDVTVSLAMELANKLLS
jgi:protoporphyrinogen oxidase